MKPLQTIALFLLLASGVCGQKVVGTDGSQAIPFMRSQGLYYYKTTYINDIQFKELYFNDSISATVYYEAHKRGFIKKKVRYTCVLERWNYPMTMLKAIQNRLNRTCYRVGTKYEYLNENSQFITVELVLVENYFVVYYSPKN
jgi:hypothetical protein